MTEEECVARKFAAIEEKSLTEYLKDVFEERI
jgi:hypothetical protein